MELRRLEDKVINEEIGLKEKDKLRQEVGELHQKLGKLYTDLSKEAANNAAAALNSQIVSNAGDKNEGFASKHKQDEKTYLDKAHDHYVHAMDSGQYDVEMRRFFSTHPLPESMRVAATGASSESGISSSLGSRKLKQSTTTDAKSADGAGTSETVDVVEPLPSLKSGHRWVVRRRVDYAEDTVVGEDPGSGQTRLSKLNLNLDKELL